MGKGIPGNIVLKHGYACTVVNLQKTATHSLALLLYRSGMYEGELPESGL